MSPTPASRMVQSSSSPFVGMSPALNLGSSATGVVFSHAKFALLYKYPGAGLGTEYPLKIVGNKVTIPGQLPDFWIELPSSSRISDACRLCARPAVVWRMSGARPAETRQTSGRDPAVAGWSSDAGQTQVRR